MTPNPAIPHGTFSLREASNRYAAVNRLVESGLSGEADLKRALDDLERATARARKARSGMVRAILMAAVLAIAACGGTPDECKELPHDTFEATCPCERMVDGEPYQLSMIGASCDEARAKCDGWCMAN